MSCVLVMTSFVVVVPGGGTSLMYGEVVCLCDGELDASLPC